jgi:predicted aspartyl protease
MKTSYSKSYAPPAPVLIISLAGLDESAFFEDQTAFIDTGADGTFIPTAFLEKLDAPVIYNTNVRSYLGERLRRVSIHQIDILVGQMRLPSVEVISDDWNNEIILGRNVLNNLHLELDGPHQTTRVK